MHPVTRPILALGIAALALALVAASGCKKPKERVLTKDQQRRIQDAILAEAPKPKTPIGASFDGKVELLGVDISASEARPGGELEITWYWKALADGDGDWKLFVHFEQPGKRQILDHHAVSDLYPIREWKAGEIIRDVQRFTVDKTFGNGDGTFWIGIYDDSAWRERKENVRMKPAQRDGVFIDGGGRVRAGKVVVKGAKKSARKATKPPRYIARHVATPPVLDGKLDDAAWTQAPRTRTFLRPDGKPLDAKLATHARVLFDDENLYVGFQVKDSDIASSYTGRDETLWKQDVVEVYLDPGADNRDYVEIQVSPTNQLFDAVFTSRRKPKWQDAAKKNLGLRSAVSVDGTVNEGSDTDRAWSVELAIPFADIPGVSGAPDGKAKWALNFYRIDGKGARNMAFQGAWAPAGGDFHNLSKAGQLTFSRAAKRPDKGAATPTPSEKKPAEGTAAPTPSEKKPAEGTPAAKPKEGEGAPDKAAPTPEAKPAPDKSAP